MHSVNTSQSQETVLSSRKENNPAQPVCSLETPRYKSQLQDLQDCNATYLLLKAAQQNTDIILASISSVLLRSYCVLFDSCLYVIQCFSLWHYLFN